MSRPLEDYALIGDCRTAALVGTNGSIDWWCAPRFDSPACFAALVGTPDNGCWIIAPLEKAARARRRYVDETLIVRTEFETRRGICRVIDFMPLDCPHPMIVRKVVGVHGRVAMRMELAARFAYGRISPQICSDQGLTLLAAGQQLALQSPIVLSQKRSTLLADFIVEPGQELAFTLSALDSIDRAPPTSDIESLLSKTRRWWLQWAARCNYQGPWRDVVIRSLLTLKALTYSATGAIVAAPTTSLPELLGGSRNWDYRYCWLRDSTFLLLTLMRAGYHQEALDWRLWLERIASGHPSELQPIYSVSGQRRLDQRDLSWLPGYCGSRPVREGNDAYRQLQLDTFGEVMDALHQARVHKLHVTPQSWGLQRRLVEHLETLVGHADKGIWESRGKPQHFTHSKVMCWVAFDRAVHAVENCSLQGPVNRWRDIRSALHAEICERGFDARIGSFVRAYGSEALDAATLLLPLVGFLPADDPRMVGTVDAVSKHLIRGGLVHRYQTHRSGDGLPESEGAFLACTCWLAENLALQNRRHEAETLFARVLDLRNDVGLLSEEYDVDRRAQIGNFPQALSHLAMVAAAYTLSSSDSPARQRAAMDPGRPPRCLPSRNKGN